VPSTSPPLHHAAIWRGPPAAALGAARAAVEAAGGAVVDARALSDLHLTLIIELEGEDLPALGAALAAAGLGPAEGAPWSAPAGPVELRLAVCTAAGGGDRRAEVPAVPG
jgi:hypothetical protein